MLRVPIGDGGDEVVEIEVDRRDLYGLEERGVVLASESAGGTRLEAVTFSLTSAIDKVMPALSAVLGTIRAGTHSPDSVTMEIGLQIGGETGIFIAKGTANASLNVTLTWNNTNAPG